jgi:hypothetical protein
MLDFRIVLNGLTNKEASELIEHLKTIEEVESATKRSRFLGHSFDLDNFRPQTAIQNTEIAIHLLKEGVHWMSDGILLGAGTQAGKHLFNKASDKLIDKLWDYMRSKFSGESTVTVTSTLFGPDDKPIKTIELRR